MRKRIKLSLQRDAMQYVADPAKGRIRYTAREFASHWISTQSSGKEKGVAMFLEPTPKFYEQEDAVNKERRSFRFLFGYVRMYHIFSPGHLRLADG